MRIRTSRYKPFMKGAPPLDYRLYLFDFDYTLVNSEPAIVKCFHITLQKLGYPDVPDERIKKTIGLPMVEAVKRIMAPQTRPKPNTSSTPTAPRPTAT